MVRWTGRGGAAALVAAIAVTTVAVPPLIAPHPHAVSVAPSPAPPTAVSVPAPPSPAPGRTPTPTPSGAPRAATTVTPTVPPTRPGGPPSPARPAIPASPAGGVRPATAPTPAPSPRAPVTGAASCTEAGTSAGAVALDASRPSCEVYAATLGTGWAVSGVGTKVMPGERVPDSAGSADASDTAVRVETVQPPAAVTFVAAAQVGVAGRGHLRLRLYGGRWGGTVVRLSLSASGTPQLGRTVVLRSPADRWTTFTLAVAGLLPAPHGPTVVRRIDIAVATDLMPRAGRFFLDDVAFVA